MRSDNVQDYQSSGYSPRGLSSEIYLRPKKSENIKPTPLLVLGTADRVDFIRRETHNLDVARPLSQIRFEFRPQKAIAVMSYFAQRLGSVDKVKLMKLVYLADREGFLRLDHPITGDQQVAMQWGPVPSSCLDLLDRCPEDAPDPFEFIHLSDNRIKPTKNAGSAVKNLTKKEVAILSEILEKHGATSTWALVRHTHSLPEWRDTYVESTSTPIPYELMLRHHAPERLLFDRPVVTPRMAKRMVSPFERSEPDL